MILQQSCLQDLVSSNSAPDQKWIQRSVLSIEKLIYLGHYLFGQVDAISEEKITNGSIDIIYESGLITFINTKEWDNFLPSLSQHFILDDRNSIVDKNLQPDFNHRIKTELGLDLKDIESLLAYLNNLLHDSEPPRLCTLKEFIAILKSKTNSPYIEPFIKGLILNRENVTDIKKAAISPYTGKRIIHKPLLTLTIDGTECILTDQFSLLEAFNTFFQNNITLGKIPKEWEQVPFLKKIRNDFKDRNKDILENPVEKLLKGYNVDYDRNVKTLYAHDKGHLSINKTPGEIDFIFIYNDTVYIADCKNLTKRYEMQGYYQDITKFTDEYNLKMKEKLEFMRQNLNRLQEHLQIKLNKPYLVLTNFKLEGIFIINTPTIYVLNGLYKIYTFNRFDLFIKGDDFFTKYIDWPEKNPIHKITWPFIDNLKKVIKPDF
ncbi:hypothetical protein [Solitalea canadensis]|nr:hypothetical protein [Solitalea canadensis]